MVARTRYFVSSPLKVHNIIGCISSDHKNNMFGHKFNTIANIEHGLNFYTMQYMLASTRRRGLSLLPIYTLSIIWINKKLVL